MSAGARSRRAAKKRKPGNPGVPTGASPVEPHAQLRDPHGALLAGIVRRDGAWVLGMHGRIAGTSDSAAEVLALIRRVARLHEAKGQPARLTCSDVLLDTAELEVAAQGMTMAQFESRLGQDMRADAAQAAAEGD